ncbi:hypothetical protein CDAR_292421 [Caerostris darwini]|uniref:Uncharacterized protein n=1 Tax=Caerostris darwini TaxID=1538125 RepID=A0AAV4UD31_9ARAC|nr:hypothetical protein CDAR_292421 [Caerostris darwini]
MLKCMTVDRPHASTSEAFQIEFHRFLQSHSFPISQRIHIIPTESPSTVGKKKRSDRFPSLSEFLLLSSDQIYFTKPCKIPLPPHFFLLLTSTLLFFLDIFKDGFRFSKRYHIAIYFFSLHPHPPPPTPPSAE